MKTRLSFAWHAPSGEWRLERHNGKPLVAAMPGVYLKWDRGAVALVIPPREG